MLIGIITKSRLSYVSTLKLMKQALCALSTIIELDKYHCYTITERTLCYWTDNVRAKML